MKIEVFPKNKKKSFPQCGKLLKMGKSNVENSGFSIFFYKQFSF